MIHSRLYFDFIDIQTRVETVKKIWATFVHRCSSCHYLIWIKHLCMNWHKKTAKLLRPKCDTRKGWIVSLSVKNTHSSPASQILINSIFSEIVWMWNSVQSRSTVVEQRPQHSKTIQSSMCHCAWMRDFFHELTLQNLTFTTNSISGNSNILDRFFWNSSKALRDQLVAIRIQIAKLPKTFFARLELWIDLVSVVCTLTFHWIFARFSSIFANYSEAIPLVIRSSKPVFSVVRLSSISTSTSGWLWYSRLFKNCSLKW